MLDIDIYSKSHEETMWGDFATGDPLPPCKWCGAARFDDLDDWPFTKHHYECKLGTWWKRHRARKAEKLQLAEARALRPEWWRRLLWWLADLQKCRKCGAPSGAPLCRRCFKEDGR